MNIKELLAKRKGLIAKLKAADSKEALDELTAALDEIDAQIEVCREKQITTVCIGKPVFTLTSVLRACFQYRKLLNSLSQMNIDLIILA